MVVLVLRYAYKCKEFYRLHPQCLDLTVVDPYSGMTFTTAIPQYFKRIFFPSLSQHCPKTITDLVKKGYVLLWAS